MVVSQMVQQLATDAGKQVPQSSLTKTCIISFSLPKRPLTVMHTELGFFLLGYTQLIHARTM